jgi:hypothetical protein
MAGVPGRAAALVMLLAVVLTVPGCTPGASFSPDGPCLADGRQPGAYPALEARLPSALGERAPSSIDSGRSCSATALGTLVSHGVDDLRFAGATWDNGGGSGASIAVLGLSSGQLPVAWVEEFYEAGARAAKKTDNVVTSRPAVEGVGQAFRVDALNDLSFQSIVVWQLGELVRVVIVASPVSPSASRQAHDAAVASAIEAAVKAP